MKSSLKNKKIAVLCGGRSGEREVSLRSGGRVFESLKKQGFDAIKIDVDGNLIQQLKKNKIDLAYIMLHGKWGEDGCVQGMLEMADIPYTGSKVLASAIGMNKIASKRIFQAVGINTPEYMLVDPDKIDEACSIIERKFNFPVVVKPTSEGSSIGVSIVKDKKKLKSVLTKTIQAYKDVFVEQFIAGREVTVGILGVGDETQALPILELAPKNEFYDYEAKYTAGMTDFILPARLPKALYKKTQEIALKAHKAIGCHGFSRVDVIVRKRDSLPFVHEVNTIPGMTSQSDLPAEANEAGICFDDLVVRILESAL